MAEQHLTSQNDPDELPPPVTHPSPPSSRQLTRNNTSVLNQSSNESQLDGWLDLKEESLDTLERSLSAKSEDPHIKKLKNDYSDFKSRPSLNFFNDVVSVSTFHLPSARTIYYPSDEDVAPGETFSDCIEALTLALRESPDTECVRTCVVSMDTGAYKLYPFRKMFLTTAKQHQRKQEAPIKAILHLIGEEWRLSPAFMESWVGIAAPKQGVSRIKRPSVSEERLTLDSANEISRRLVWFAEAPEYKGKLSTYVFRPYTEPPKPFSAEIVISGTGSTSRDVLILFGFDCGLNDWSVDSKDRLFDWNGESAITDITWDILRSLRVLCSYVIEDTEGFAQSLDERISDAIYKGRRRPSRSRLQYLLCLEDSCRIALLGLKDTTALIEDLSEATELKFPEIEQHLQEWFESAKSDIEYLQEELRAADRRILDVRVMIKDQLELGNDRRTNLLTLLAAIYIPFSFVSSFFGMNLKDPLWSKKKASDSVHAVSNQLTHTKRIDSSPNSMPLFNTNDTEAIINAIAQSGTHLFSFKDYWIITLSVVAATILFPIIVGPVFRFSVRKLLRNTAFIVPILMLLTIIASLATSLKNKFAAFTGVILFPFALAAIGLTIYASIKGKDQILWCGFAFTYGTSLWIDTFVRDFRIINTPKGPWVAGLLPPAYMLITHCGINVNPRFKALLWKWFSIIRGAEEKTKRERFRAAVVFLYHGIVIAYWYNVRDRGTLLAIPHAILAANRLLSTTRDSNPKRFYIWLGFLIIWICSVSADRHLAPSRFSGFFIAFFPMWALFGFWAYLDYKAGVHEILGRYWRREEKRGKAKPMLEKHESLPARSRRQTMSTSHTSSPTHSRRQTLDTPRASLPARSRHQSLNVSPVY